MNFISCTVVQFYSAEFVCAADCHGSAAASTTATTSTGSNEGELKRSIKNVNSPNWDVKWRITVRGVNGAPRDPTNRPRRLFSLITRATKLCPGTLTELKAGSRLASKRKQKKRTRDIVVEEVEWEEGREDAGAGVA